MYNKETGQLTKKGFTGVAHSVRGFMMQAPGLASNALWTVNRFKASQRTMYVQD